MKIVINSMTHRHVPLTQYHSIPASLPILPPITSAPAALQARLFDWWPPGDTSGGADGLFGFRSLLILGNMFVLEVYNKTRGMKHGICSDG